MLGTNISENLRMLGEEMVGEDRAGGSGIVAGKDEELDLSHCEVFEISVDASGFRIFIEVGLQRKINHGFVPVFCFALNGAITTVDFAGKIAIHPMSVVHVNKWTKDIHIF